MTIRLNAGCGDERRAGYIGLDIRTTSGTDVVCDLTSQLPFDDGSVAHIRAKSFLEHVADLETLLAEFSRVLAPGGTLYIYVPHWSNPFYYSDYTHQRFFGLKTFDYFAPMGNHRYSSPPRYSNIEIETTSVRLLFNSPFKLLHYAFKGVQLIVNQHPRLQVFYEFHLSNMIPCYALEYKLKVA